MNHTTPSRLNTRDPSASTVRKTSLVEWNKALETPMYESIKSPHQIANHLRKSATLDTPPSFTYQTRANIRNPNESFEIDACEVSMLLSEDFSEIEEPTCITPKTFKISDLDGSSLTDTPTQTSFKRSRDIALESLDYLVSTSPCKLSYSTSFSTPRMSLNRFLKKKKILESSCNMDKLSTGKRSTRDEEETPRSIESSNKENILEIGESIGSVSDGKEDLFEVML